MQGLMKKDNELLIKFNTEELSPVQLRLIKSVNSLLAHVLTAEDEAEYFEISAELMKKTAELIKHSQFASDHKEMAYGEQAVEFAVDFLNESFGQDKQTIDN